MEDLVAKAQNPMPLHKGSQRLFVLFWFLWVVALLAVATSNLQDNIQLSLSDPVFFHMREYLHKTPELSPRLKVYAFDDSSVSFLKSPELSTQDLSLLLQNIAEQKPKAILLDRLFSLAQNDEGEKEALAALRAKGIPVYSGASMSEKKVAYRSQTVLSEEDYGFKHWISHPNAATDAFVHRNLYNSNSVLYAYDAAYEGAFRGVGHLAFDKRNSVYPMIVMKDRIIPHLALYAADSVDIKDDQLFINDKPVPLNSAGGVIVNHRPVAEYYKNMKSLRPSVIRARNHQPETWVKEGDVVVILFNFYTGSTDFVNSAPFGNLPGGLFVSTLVDSILQNHWLTPFGQGPWLIFAMSLIGMILARVTGPVAYWGASLGLSALYFVVAVYLFVYHSVVISWVLPLLGLMGAGTIQYVQQRLGSELKAVATENQLLIERTLRLEEEKTNLQLAERLNLGRAVQKILLPPIGTQDHGRFTFTMSYIPAQEMSGDWIYIWGKDKTEKRIIVGDVVGKGPSAAIPVAILIGILGECEKDEMPMIETLHYLNKRVLELFGGQITCSCSVIIINETNSGEVELYNAGSPGWFLKAPDRSRHIAMRSTPLGMDAEAYFAHETLQLPEGAFLLTFTDGYMEGARAYKRLITKLGTLEETPAFTELQLILDDIGKTFRLEDDRSLLLVHPKTHKAVQAA